MPALPRHDFFDWNGTLQDDVLAAVAGTNALLRDQGRPEISLERYREVFSFPARSSYAALGIEDVKPEKTLAQPSSRRRVMPSATARARISDVGRWAVTSARTASVMCSTSKMPPRPL